MAVPSKNFTVIADSAIDADSPLTEDLMTDLRDNDIHLEEWLGLSYTAATNHDHDGINSKAVLGGVFKPVDENVNDSTTLQNDNDLSFPVVANRTYWFDMIIHTFLYSGSDFKYQITTPALSGSNNFAEIHNAAVLRAYNTAISFLISANGNYSIIIKGAFEVGGSGGYFILEWAQDTAQVINTIIKRSSVINYKVIG